MLVIAALGQSALASQDLPALEARIRSVASGLAPVARTHQLVITHSANARLLPASAHLPADLQAAQAGGLIGHLLARELRNVLPRAAVTSLLAQAVVPSGRKEMKRVQPSPGVVEVAPCRVVETPLLRQLVERDHLILCVGCVPVQLNSESQFVASDAPLDHDQVAATLGVELGADILLLLTDVPAIYEQWPERVDPIERFDSREQVPASLDARSIGSKLQAACRFARTPGTFAVIGSADAAEALVAGREGTCVAMVK